MIKGWPCRFEADVWESIRNANFSQVPGCISKTFHKQKPLVWRPERTGRLTLLTYGSHVTTHIRYYQIWLDGWLPGSSSDKELRGHTELWGSPIQLGADAPLWSIAQPFPLLSIPFQLFNSNHSENRRSNKAIDCEALRRAHNAASAGGIEYVDKGFSERVPVRGFLTRVSLMDTELRYGLIILKRCHIQ